MNPFERVPLGGTDVRVTRLGLGLAPLAGLFHAVGDETAAATVDAAWDAGIRYFDTAPLYGLGLSERRAGRALAGRSGFTLSTKVGRLLVPGAPDEPMWAERSGLAPVFDYSADGVRRSYLDSLERLGLKRADILHIHDPDEHFAAAMAGARPALVALREAGEIGAVSAGMNQSAMLTAFARTGDFDCFLLAGRYTLLDQSGLADLLPECADRGISVIIGGGFNSGVPPHPSTGGPVDYAPAPPPLVAKGPARAGICAVSPGPPA